MFSPHSYPSFSPRRLCMEMSTAQEQQVTCIVMTLLCYEHWNLDLQLPLLFIYIASTENHCPQSKYCKLLTMYIN